MSGGGEDIAQAEAQARLEKFSLEIEKLRYDKQLAARQLTRSAVALEWFKAGSVVVTLIGVIVTLAIGQSQLNQTRLSAEQQDKRAEETRLADSFDKALNRLADHEKVGTRMSGVSALRSVLHKGSVAYQTEALQNLITAIAHETSLEVRQRIMDSFSDLSGVAQEAKDQALVSAVALDKSLTAEFVSDNAAARVQKQREMYAKFTGKDVKDLPPVLTYVEFRALTAVQETRYRSLYYAPLFPVTNAQSEDTTALDDLVTIINYLIKAGARNTTGRWESIYCRKCDFTPAIDLSGQNFDASYLAGANFSQVKLAGSTFRNADLAQTVFFHSNLTGADLSWDKKLIVTRDGPQANALRNGDRVYPTLECAILHGTKLTGLPLVFLSREVENPRKDGGSLSLPAMWLAEGVTSAQMDGVGARIERTYAASYFDERQWNTKGSYGSATLKLSRVDKAHGIGGSFARTMVAPKVELDLDEAGHLSGLTRTELIAFENIGDLKDWTKPAAIEAPFWRSQPQLAKAFAGQKKAPAPPLRKYNCKQKTVPSEDELDDLDEF